jgi:hypothetical protein
LATVSLKPNLKFDSTNMRILGLLFLIPIIISASDLDPTWLSNDEWLFAETNSLLDQTASLFDVATFPADPESYDADASALMPLLMDPVELASSELTLPLDQDASLFDVAKPHEDSLLDYALESGFTALPFDQVEPSLSQAASFFDEPASLSGLPTSSEESKAYSPYSSEPLFEDTPTWSQTDDVTSNVFWDDIILKDSFEVADCSTSEFLSSIGKKSRVRRRDDSRTCEAPATIPPTDAKKKPKRPDRDSNPTPPRYDPARVDEVNQQLFYGPDSYDNFLLSGDNPETNSFCYLVTQTFLPFGVCSSGNISDETPAASQLMRSSSWGGLPIWTLSQCTLSMFPLIYYQVSFVIFIDFTRWASMYLNFNKKC